mgnify:CR=1 FL=1
MKKHKWFHTLKEILAELSVIPIFCIFLAVAIAIYFALPDRSLCGDNGAMIALAGYFEYKKGNFADTSLNASAYSPLD